MDKLKTDMIDNSNYYGNLTNAQMSRILEERTKMMFKDAGNLFLMNIKKLQL